MNKTEMVRMMASNADIPMMAASKAFDTVFNCIMQSLMDGERGTIIGFGSFSVGHRKARNGRNPRTGAPMMIPGGKRVKFRPSKNLKMMMMGKGGMMMGKGMMGKGMMGKGMMGKGKMRK